MSLGRPPLFLVASACALFFLAGCGDGGNAPKRGKEAPVKSPAAVAQESIAALIGTTPPATANAAFALYEKLAKERDAASAAAASSSVVSAWANAANEMRDTVLKLDPDHAKVRAELGEVAYKDALVPYLTAAYLLETDRVDAQRLHDKLGKKAERNHGWLKKDDFGPVETLIARLEPKRANFESRKDSPFYAEAEQMRLEIDADLNKRFENRIGDAQNPWRGVVMAIHEPFVFFIQDDPSWDPVSVANSRSRELLGVQEIILSEYGKELGLTPVKKPVPVLMFRRYDDYLQYAGQTKEQAKSFAHFEPGTGRLAVHDSCSHTTVMHEGTHQLMFFWTKNRLDPGRRAYWWNEGIAEWYSAAERSLDPVTKQWKYEIGRLHQGRMNSLAGARGSVHMERTYPLKELLETRYIPHKAIAESTNRVEFLYAQAWFFIYFLNYYNVDDQGYVRYDRPGVYQAGWHRYVTAELNGKSGLPVFLQALNITLDDLPRMQEEFWNFFAFVRRKDNLGQVVDGRMVPYNHEKVHRGKQREDLLIEKEGN